MGATRQSTHLTPIKIFNDSFGTDQGSQNHALSSPLDNAPSLLPTGNVLAPKSDMNSKVIPPSRAGRSPSKPGVRNSSPPLKHALSNTPNISFPTPKLDQSTDSLIKKPSPPASYQNIAPSLSQSGTFLHSNMNSADKENAFSAYSSDNYADFPGPEYVPKGTNKRRLTDASPLDQRASKRAGVSTTSSSGPLRIPEPNEMPEIIDDGSKPRYTYAQLVAMAILRSPQRKLTLSSIYEWISNTFAFYKEASAGGWQNSIRHNLSLHKAFSKIERPRHDPGKGNYWIIEPEMIGDFLDEKQSRRPASTASSSHRPSSRPSSSHGPQSQTPGPVLAPMKPLQQQEQQSSQQQQQQQQQRHLHHQQELQQLPPQGRQTMQPPPSRRLSSVAPAAPVLATAHQIAELSSDATIPLSDPALLEEDGEDTWVDIVRPSSRARQSSPQPPMRSSPPIAAARSRASTGAGNELFPSSQRSRKRKHHMSMNDSGYYSSLESSAMRRPQSRAGLDSLAPARKRGRAEDEIARLRSSSQDISPSKNGLYLGVPRNSTPGLLSSSPIRPLDQPLTPGPGSKSGLRSKDLHNMKLPAPTLSPDTQLANHRNKVNELIGTPFKEVTGISDDLFGDLLTPNHQSFNMLEESFDLAGLSPNIRFSFFGDDMSPLKRRGLAGRSPEKFGSAVRPGLLRSNTTPGRALGDITRTAGNRPSPAGLKPPVKFTSKLGSPLRFASPEKSTPTAAKPASNDALTLTSSPFKRLFGDWRSPIKFASPYNSKIAEGILDPDPGQLFDFGAHGNMFSLDLFADEDSKVDSPTENRGQILGLDLAGGFSKIGSEASKDKENLEPPTKKAKSSKSGLSRPPLGGRSSTSFM